MDVADCTLSLSATSIFSNLQASQTPQTPPPKHRVLEDTPIAALTLPNGDRRLFFQEFTGTIRQAMYAKNNDNWAADPTPAFQLANDARNSTPLAAIPGPILVYNDVSHTILSRALITQLH